MTNLIPGYATWFHSLPLFLQPMVSAFMNSLLPWLAIAIFEQHWIATHGKSPAKKLSLWVALPLCMAAFYFKGRYPAVQAMLDWPDRNIPGWHLHWWQFVVGGVAAGLIAKQLGVLYAALFMRSRRQSVSMGGDLQPALPASVISIIRRTRIFEEE